MDRNTPEKPPASPENKVDELQRIDALRGGVETLRAAFEIPKGEAAGWDELVLRVLKPLRTVSEAGVSDTQDIDSALELRGKYGVLSQERQGCIDALELCLRTSVERGSGHRFSESERTMVRGMLSKYAEEFRAYDTLWEETSVEAKPREVEKGRVEEILKGADALRASLKMPEGITGSFRQLLEDVSKDLPAPERAVDPGAQRLAFLREQHASLLHKKQALFEMLELFLGILRERGDHAFEELERSVLLESLTEYWQGKREYEHLWHRAEKKPPLPPYVALFVEEFAEEGVEAFLPLKEEWSCKWLRDLDRATQRKLAGASLRLQQRFIRAGMRNAPQLTKFLVRDTHFGGYVKDILKETGKSMRPDSYFTLLLYAYYVHTSDDKMGAAMQFASFLALSGLSNAALAIAERRLGASVLAKIPGHPVVKIAAAILICVGAEKLGLSKAIERVEKHFDPAVWDGGGVIADILGAGTIIEGVGELGYQTGLRLVDPEIDQIEYLGQKQFTAQGRKGEPPGMNYWHDIRDWDDQVQWRMKLESNPVLRRLWGSQLIVAGPGGRRGWIARQALRFHQGWSRLRGAQDQLDPLLTKLGILQNPWLVHLDNLVTTEADVHGDTGVRTVLQSEFHVRADSEIERLVSERPDDPDVKMCAALRQRCKQMAMALANLRSVYVNLEVYSEDWVRGRKALVGGTEQAFIPTIVEDGMIGELVLQSTRKEAVGIDANADLSPGEYGQRLAQVLQIERKRSDAPSILGDPIGWFQWFRQHNSEYDSRVMRAHSKELLTIFAGELARSLPQQVRQQVFEPLQDIIVEQSDENLVEPYMAAQALLAAYLKVRGDGELRKRERLYIFGDFTSENFQIPIPQERRPSAPRVDEKYADRFPNVEIPEAYPPVIVSTRVLGGSSKIDSLVEFEFDPERNVYTVVTTAAGTVIVHNGRSITRVTVREPLDVWLREHPQFALYVADDLRRYEVAKRLEHTQWQRWMAAEDAALRDGQHLELKNQDQVRELARRRPNIWHYYPSHLTRIDEKNKEPAYEYVAYLPDARKKKGMFVYLQSPWVYRGVTAVSNGSRHVREKVGNTSKTRITLEGYNPNEIHPDFALVNEPQLAFAFREALVLPIPGNPRKSVQKLLNVYVKSLEDRDVIAMEDEIVEMYEQLQTDSQRHRFLSSLQWHIHHATRDTASEGILGPTYKKQEVGYYLTKSLYGEEVREPLRRSFGFIRKAA